MFADNNKVHCLVNADLLDYDVSDKGEKSLERHMKNAEAKGIVLAPMFVHPVISRIRFLHVKCKIIGKVKMETTTMWAWTIIILKDIKCFQIWAYFEGLGINFNFEIFHNIIFPLFMLRTIQICMCDITGRCNICQKSRVGLFTLHFHWNVKNCSGIRIKTIKIIL